MGDALAVAIMFLQAMAVAGIERGRNRFGAQPDHQAVDIERQPLANEGVQIGGHGGSRHLIIREQTEGLFGARRWIRWLALRKSTQKPVRRKLTWLAANPLGTTTDDPPRHR